jgi:superfamily II DNA/RNA helicase
VATPGRLLDLVDAGALNLGSVECVVLDEADKMLNLGFAPQLDRLRSMLLPPAAPDSGGGGGEEGPRKKKRKGQAEGAGAGAADGAARRRRPQVLLFTATMPREVEVTAGAWLAAGAARVRSAPSAESISKTITQVRLYDQLCATAAVICNINLWWSL